SNPGDAPRQAGGWPRPSRCHRRTCRGPRSRRMGVAMKIETPSSTERREAQSFHRRGDRPPNALRDRFGALAREAGLASVVIVLVLVFGIARPLFLSGDNMLAILVQASVVGVLAIGQTYVLLTAGIDLSIGSIVA